MIYLDHNATTPALPVAVEAVSASMAGVGNASSVHAAGRGARSIVEGARQAVATLIKADPKSVIFTSGATEANNTVIKHFANSMVMTGSCEHPSVIEAAPDALRIPTLPSGLIDTDAYQDMLNTHKPALVSIMLVNNETGVIQPIQNLAALAHEAGAKFHCDGVQAAGRIDIDFTKLGADYLTLSAHKMGGPQGVGALVVAPKAPPVKLIHGGGQERRQRAGTENVAGIAGMGAAAKAADHKAYQRLAALRDKIESEIAGITVFGKDAPRVANTTCFALAGVPADTQLMALDLAGICVSSGSACSSGSVKPSHVLEAMGIAPALAGCALRVSLGWTTTAAEIDTFIATYKKLQSTWHK
ncbi:MAG: cysteine desulfurase [Alphaproteobacteria bacterium]|nr:cysteine desulfurase [Alphaproteobacteria bacterium]